jgi:hypothetical protein
MAFDYSHLKLWIFQLSQNPALSIVHAAANLTWVVAWKPLSFFYDALSTTAKLPPFLSTKTCKLPSPKAKHRTTHRLISRSCTRVSNAGLFSIQFRPTSLLPSVLSSQHALILLILHLILAEQEPHSGRGCAWLMTLLWLYTPACSSACLSLAFKANPASAISRCSQDNKPQKPVWRLAKHFSNEWQANLFGGGSNHQHIQVSDTPTSHSDQRGFLFPLAAYVKVIEKDIEDGVKAHAHSALIGLSPSFTVIALVARINILGIIIDLPTCLRLAQSACVFDITARFLLSLAFHETIANMDQVINGFCGARFESAMRYRVKT